MVLAIVASAVVLVAVVGTGPKPAEAALPGKNGRIAFTSDRDGDFEIYTMNANGSGATSASSPASSIGSIRWVRR